MDNSITIISLNYYPEDTAIGLYSTQMAEYLQSQNWEVTVITGFPYYPQWKITKAYQNKKRFFKETINGVSILRYKQFVPSNPSFIKRIFHIIDFTFGSFFNIKKVKKTNIVLSVIPFTSSAWLGKKLAKRLNAKHWIHIQDFEFDAAFESGLTSNKGLLKKLFKIESNILNSANIVSTISNGMLSKLKNKSQTQQCFFPNWVDEKFIDPSRYKQHKYLTSNKFKILYSGNIGAKQDWNFFLNIANRFKDNQTIEFIIVGEGANKKELKDAIKHLQNVIHYSPIPYDELNDLLCSADLHILFQKENVIDTVMPSKILGMMASSKPSLITGSPKSEVAKVFDISKGGSFSNATNFDRVEQAIKLYCENKTLCLSTGTNARSYVVSHFSKESVLENFNEKLKSLIKL